MIVLTRLFFFFTLTTLLELFLLMELAKVMGLGTTLALVILTGFLGAYLARLEGLRVLEKLRSDLSSGAMPADAALDGLCVLVAGALLITPGVLTDILGFGLLMAPLRLPLKAYAKVRFRSWMARQEIHVVSHSGYGPNPRHPWQPPQLDPYAEDPSVIDVTPED